MITRLKYRANGADFLPDVPAVLWRLELESGQRTRWLAPEQPISEFAWWPDGRGAVLVSSRNEVAGAIWQQEAYDLPLSGSLRSSPTGTRRSPTSRRTRTACASRPRPAATPSATTPIRTVLFTPAGETYSAERLDPHDFPAGNLVSGDLHVGQFPDRPCWLDGERLAFLATLGGASGIFTLNLAGEITPQTFEAQRVVAAFSASDKGAVWFSESASQVPQVMLNGVQVSECPAPDFAVSSPQRVTFQTERGEGEGWALLPAGEVRRPPC